MHGPDGRRARSAWAAAPGEELIPGRRVRTLLGGGDRCQAFLTWNAALERTTVVKVLRPDRVDDRAARRRMRRERDLLLAVDDGPIHRLLASDTDGARPFLELEHVEGPRLSTSLRRHGPLDEQRLVELGRCLAAAVRHLHRHGVLHLDVKPRNVLLGRIPRLIDLSIARRVDEVARLRSPVGTDAYMAPEQCDRERMTTIGPAADVWGIGVTLYRAATTRLPYPRGECGRRDVERWPQLTHVSISPPAGAPPLVEMVMACLERDPAARPSPAELLDRLDEVAADRGLEASADAPDGVRAG